MKAKALQNFYSAEHGSVEAGAEMNFQNEALMQQMVEEGYVQQIDDNVNGNSPIQSNLNENPMPVNEVNDTVMQQSVQDTEFSSEAMSAKEMQAMQNAQKQNTEFSSDLSANAQKVAQKTANEQNAQMNATQSATQNEAGAVEFGQEFAQELGASEAIAEMQKQDQASKASKARAKKSNQSE